MSRPAATAEQPTVVRNYFDDASTSWGQRYQQPPRGMADVDLLMRRRNIHELLQPILDAATGKLQIIDVGCGSGDVLAGIPRDKMRVFGMDFSPEMVRHASIAHPQDRFLAGDATRLPLAFDSADVAVSSGVIEYIPDPLAAVAGIVATLKPGGHLIISFPNRKSVFRHLLQVERSLERTAHRAKNALRGKAESNGSGNSRYRHRQWSVREVTNLLRRAGLVVEEVRINTFGPWGRLGRLRMMSQASQSLSARFKNANAVTTRLGSTLVIRARKPGDNA